MFINRKYLELYTNESPKEIHEFVDKYQNGEDISMVAVVGNFLREVDKSQCSCLWVREGMVEIKNKRSEPFPCFIGLAYSFSVFVFFSSAKRKIKGLHQLSSHFEERTECLNMLAAVYKSLPIEHCTSFVARLK